MNAAEDRARERAQRNERVPFAWRVVKVDWTSHCGEDWRAEAGIDRVYVYYLYDANRHVHICSFTPSQECFPVAYEVTFTSDEAREADEGESELELQQAEDPCSYFDVRDVERMPSRPVPWAPDREPDEDAEAYYERACEEFREHFAGNPPHFDGPERPGRKETV
jgi:hypothetical protein